jgi:hypothetical protein
MPPRYVYWTILIDDKPTAFRSHKREELLPTFVQLRRANPNIVMKFFARGKLWDNPEQARWAAEHAARKRESRGRDWRPGGQHKDPRAASRPSRRASNEPAASNEPGASRRPARPVRKEHRGDRRPTSSRERDSRKRR